MRTHEGHPGAAVHVAANKVEGNKNDIPIELRKVLKQIAKDVNYYLEMH